MEVECRGGGPVVFWVRDSSFSSNGGVDRARYVAMLRNFFRPQLDTLEINMAELWFQQDGATAHTVNYSMAVAREMFPQHLISHFGDVHWPARSPDLSVCDFFLWGYLKSKVYCNKPRTLNDLKVAISEEIAAVSNDTLTKVMTNFEERLLMCIGEGGRHLSDIFKK